MLEEMLGRVSGEVATCAYAFAEKCTDESSTTSTSATNEAQYLNLISIVSPVRISLVHSAKSQILEASKTVVKHFAQSEIHKDRRSALVC